MAEAAARKAKEERQAREAEQRRQREEQERQRKEEAERQRIAKENLEKMRAKMQAGKPVEIKGGCSVM